MFFKKLKLKSFGKSLLSLGLAGVICLSSISAVNVYADVANDGANTGANANEPTAGSTSNSANDLVAAYINLAAGKSQIGNDGSLKFTKDQLRFLGVYVSNYFVPFATELGAAKDDSIDTTSESIKSALTTGLNFKEDMAESFTEYLLGLIRGNTKDLVFAASTKQNPKSRGDYIVGTKYTLANNYYNFTQTMLGNTKELLNRLQSGKYKENIDSLQTAYWGYMEGNEFVPVYDCYVDYTYGVSACQVAFEKCLESVPSVIDDDNDTAGYGWSLFDLFEGEVGADKDLEKTLTGSTALKMTVLGETMKVDCFGDILVCGKQHQLVAIPGAINPYTWVAVDSSGNDTAMPGKVYNVINIPSMSAASVDMGTKRSLYSSVGTMTVGTDSNVSDAGTSGSGKATNKSYNLYSKSSKLGLAAQAAANSLLGWKGFESDIRKAFKYVLSYADGAGVNSSDWTVTVSKSSGITVKAPLKTWASVDTRKLAKDFKYVDKAKHDKLEDAFNTIQKGYKGSLFGYGGVEGVGRDSVIEVIKSASDKAKADLSAGSGSSTPASGSTNNSSTLRSFTPYYATGILYKNSSDAQIPVGPTYTLYRGTKTTNADFNPLPGKSSKFWDSLNNAVKEYEKLYPNDKSINAFKVSMYTVGSNYVTGPVFNVVTNLTPVPMVDNFILIDTLGDYHFDDSTEQVSDYKAFNSVHYINDDGSTIESSSNLSFGSDDTWAAGYSDMKAGKFTSPSNVSEATAVSLYTTYVMSCLYQNDSTSKENTIGKTGVRMNIDGLPEIASEAIEISTDSSTDVMLTAIKDWLYYLLHPTKGLNYFRELLSNKLESLLVGWHNDMLGTSGVGNTLGTTRYRNTTGYVTTPDLSEIEWTNSLISFYNTAIPFLIIVMIILMVFAYVTGIFSIQKSIFGVVMFSVFLLLPVNLINGVVGASNRISEKLYGEKFTYWALIQMETYASSIDEAASGDSNASAGEDGSYENYLVTLYNQNSATYANQGNESIVLKWQTPKKMTSLMFQSDDSYKSLTDSGKQMLNMFLGTAMTGESFVGDPDSVYLYRSYVDISNYSRYIYRSLKEGRRGINGLSNAVTDSFTYELQNAIDSLDSNYTADRAAGYANKDDNDNGIKIKAPLSSSFVSDTLNQKGTVKSLTLSDFVGINPDVFNFSIPAFNNTSKSIKDYVLDSVDGSRHDTLSKDVDGYNEGDFSGLAAYSLYSENVFYYFSWDLYDLGLQPSSDTNSGYKDLLLGDNNAGFFYNTTGNGELKDFMDMKSLFTYIIPYLKQCNDLVHEWDNVYGIFTYDGVPTEEGHWKDEDIKNSLEMQQKYWHNLNVARLYSIYTPWVDIMYDCSYAKGETIKALGSKFFVDDPLDPSQYPTNRPMIFSESEMQDYGLGRGDLTKVEKLILDCNRGMEERMYDLLNYYSFSDVTLNTAAAMNCAFEFNTTFSENGLFSDNHNIYPQAFELSDFSYDAFLRFILSNTTGESLLVDTSSANGSDFYGNIVRGSSVTTVIVMILLDVISMYVLPAFKIFFIIILFLCSILIILATAFRVDPNMKFIKNIWDGVLLPMAKFFLVTIGFSYVVSLFMGKGNNSVTQDATVSIRMGSPVTVMFAMIVVNILVLILYFKIIKGVIDSIRHYGKMSLNFVGGVAGASIGLFGGLLSKLRPSSNKKPAESQDIYSGEPVSSSAKSRAEYANSDEFAKNVAEDKQSTRVNDVKRDTINSVEESKEDNKSKTDQINKRTKSGTNKMEKQSHHVNEKPQKPTRSTTREPRFTTHNVKDLGDGKK